MTGGSRGIGYAITKILSENGISVVITAKNPKRLKKSVSEISNSIGIVADVRKPEDVKCHK